jgi:hypothetical protein
MGRLKAPQLVLNFSIFVNQCWFIKITGGTDRKRLTSHSNTHAIFHFGPPLFIGGGITQLLGLAFICFLNSDILPDILHIKTVELIEKISTNVI